MASIVIHDGNVALVHGIVRHSASLADCGRKTPLARKGPLCVIHYQTFLGAARSEMTIPGGTKSALQMT